MDFKMPFGIYLLAPHRFFWRYAPNCGYCKLHFKSRSLQEKKNVSQTSEASYHNGVQSLLSIQLWRMPQTKWKMWERCVNYKYLSIISWISKLLLIGIIYNRSYSYDTVKSSLNKFLYNIFHILTQKFKANVSTSLYCIYLYLCILLLFCYII